MRAVWTATPTLQNRDVFQCRMETPTMTTRLRPFALLLFVSILTLTTASSTYAQQPETVEQFLKGPHIGPAAEAVVGVEVTHTADMAEKIVWHGNGLLLRCDGFVLLPVSLFGKPAILKDKEVTTKVSIILSPGTQKAQKVAVPLPRVLRTGVHYVVVKLPNVHIPAVRTLLPDKLETGDEIQIVWSGWDTAAQTFLPPQRHKLQIGKREEATLQSKGTLSFTEPQSGIPAGAVVLGPEEMAVGMVTNGQAVRFATMTDLDQVTNCITPLSTTEAEFAKKQPFLSTHAFKTFPANEEATEEEGKKIVPDAAPGMVAVPGGPVRLTPAILSTQKDMKEAVVACVAPFLIDRYEVTNGQYLAFLKSLPDKQLRDFRTAGALFPLSWNEQEPFFPDELTDVPVLGVTYEAAKAYAKWAGKRLMTPYEWSLAAFGPTGGNVLPDWAKQYVSDRQKTWQEVVEAHLNYLNQSPTLLQQYKTAVMKLRTNKYEHVISVRKIKTGQNPVDSNKTEIESANIMPFSEPAVRELMLPWYFYLSNQGATVVWSRDIVLSAVAPLFKNYKTPMAVLPVGSRDFDVSPYGAYDMVLNAFELICSSPDVRRIEADAHYMRVRWTPININANPYDDINRGTKPFLAWYEVLYRVDREAGDLMFLSRRLRSATSNAKRGETVLPNELPRSIAAANLYEIATMLTPLNGWEILPSPGRTITTGHLAAFTSPNSPLADMAGQSPPLSLDGKNTLRKANSNRLQNFANSNVEPQNMAWYEAYSYQWWRQSPRYYVQEMGRPFDLDAPEGRYSTDNTRYPFYIAPRETYLVPGGFRCVR